MDALLEDLADVYRDLHAHPELGFAETRTAGIVAARLRTIGFEVTEGVGQTGVVGVLERGTGPTVRLRADMDALPVAEETGLPYASTARGVLDGKDVPVMHACGHDMHTTALLGALATLAAQDDWTGKILAVFQPAEETGGGARAMIEDDLFARFGTPDVVLGQHVGPLPAGAIGLRAGASFAASDALDITLYGRGGHGSRPEVTVDPVVMAAAVVMRLQTVISPDIAGTDVAVLTVGSIHAGEAPNVIPDSASLQLSIRSYDTAVRDRMIAAIERIVRGEAAAAGADREPRVELLYELPAVFNDADAVARVGAAMQSELEGIMVIDPGVITGSEDVGRFAEAAGVPCVYWILGGADPAHFAGLASVAEITERVMSLPSNHSPQFAPAIMPTLGIGIRALVTAARSWLA
ncbi:MAG TPA: amidohydrolase [Microbacteriaceae bacterium]|jgi:hippurate hydrolase|nr:amidohydrolase [Microbacteriaceae bacterium]HQX34937.1 amidohydrolase [Microbacteriaceae bacterium]HQZ48293.1 amidohydrolase [Microbacteriaceae bacterium]HRA08984.1 amidohydrolase [Microbacteriaceae bacterium]